MCCSWKSAVDSAAGDPSGRFGVWSPQLCVRLGWWYQLAEGINTPEHFKGKPCRINKTGYNVPKWPWGLIGGEGILLLLFWWSELQTAGFSPSLLGDIIHWAIFLSHKRRYVGNQTELCATGKVKREIEKVTRLHNTYSRLRSSLKSVRWSF